MGESGSDGIAKVGKKALKGLQVRGLLESKTAADVLEYFDENIVPVPKRVTRALTVKLNVTAVDFGIAGVDSELFEEYTVKHDYFHIFEIFIFHLYIIEYYYLNIK